MKRIVSLLLVLFITLPLSSCFHDNWDIPERENPDFNLGELFGLIAPALSGIEAMPNGIVLTLSDDESFYIVSDASKCEAEKVTIPKSYKGIPIKEIARGAFSKNDNIVKLSIPSSVINIGYDAFLESSKLEFNVYEGAKYLGNEENPYHALIEFTETAISSPAIHEETRAISAGACKNINAQNFKKIVIPDSVVSVCDAAFEMCSNVHTLVIGNGVETIGDSAFSKMIRLTDLIVGNSVKTIGEMAFYSAASLENLALPDSVTEIGKSAFSSCDKLRKADLGEAVKTIGADAFLGCESLESVGLGESLESIGNKAFSGTALASVSLPHTLEYIGLDAFADCPDSLFNFWDFGWYLGNSENPYEYLIKIDNGFFNIVLYPSYSSSLFMPSFSLHPDTRRIAFFLFGMNFVYGLHIPGNSKYLTVKNNCIIDKTEKKLIAGTVGATIPTDGSVTSIGDYAFYGIEGLPLTSIPKSVTHIGDYAFAHSLGFSKITFEGAASIGNYAFYECANITAVYFEEQTPSIGDSAFALCRSLTKIDIPDSVTYLGESVFEGCSKLSQVYIGSQVDVIRENTFSMCSALRSVTLGGEPKVIETRAFYSCSSLNSFEFKEGLEYIGPQAFNLCSKLVSIDLPDSLVEIGYSAFSSCSKIETVYLGSGLERIGNDAFSGISTRSDLNYRGTVKMWEKIENARNLCRGISDIVVKCTDGEIVLEPDPISVVLD
ncbi:MAG: leucine-rich repeat domain-containing protein [Clostridia bacterium]|nr:leucine-rich repeat domain-containing protein [Clostridia bacterium]